LKPPALHCVSALQSVPRTSSAHPPHHILPCRAVIISIDRFTTDLYTQGGPVNLGIRNIGFGRHVVSSPVSMSYSNGNFTYDALGCHVQWNGSTVSCVAAPGVGRAHRWTMALYSFGGFTSPPDVVTNYKGPILYDIFSEFNTTRTAASEGLDVFNLTGANFGPISDNAVTWVRFAPFAFPAVEYEANCTLVEDHHVLRCITGGNAGEDHRWTINVGNQISEIPYTSTRVPNVTSVSVLHTGYGLRADPGGAVVGAMSPRAPRFIINANVSQGLVTMGGGLVLLRGTYVALAPPPLPAPLIPATLARCVPAAFMCLRLCCPRLCAWCQAVAGVLCYPPPPEGRNFGPDRPDVPLLVTFRPSRGRPASPDQYHVSILGNSNGSDLSQGPATVYPITDTQECFAAAVITPFREIACVMPQGYGGQLEWQVTVLNRSSVHFRCERRPCVLYVVEAVAAAVVVLA
jgi:hypothetical protein